MPLKPVVQLASKKFFSLIHQNNLVYNTCWEDPRLDREAMKIGSQDEVLVITSAGCNALEYLLDEPKRVHAVDMNPRQNALLELKKSAIRNLDFEDFFQIFGKGSYLNFGPLYKEKLRPDLPPFSQKIWDAKLHYFYPHRVRRSLYYRGTSGFFATLMGFHIGMKKLCDEFESLFEAESLEAQASIYHDRIAPRFWSKSLRWALCQDATLALLGVPRAQRKLIDEKYAGGVERFLLDCFERVLTKLPLQDNYFWWLYLTGSYTPTRCPEYLKEENFLKLKSGLLDRLQTHNSSILSFLEKFDGKISRYVLLDHMDWLAENNKDVLKKQWQKIVDRADRKTRILYRSGGPEVDFVDPIPVVVNSQKLVLGDVLDRQSDLAARLHSKDRVHTYGSFYIDDLQLAS